MCRAALKDFPDHPYLLFLLGHAGLGAMDFDPARDAFRRARASAEARQAGVKGKAGQKPDELEKAIVEALENFEGIAPQIVLQKAGPKMKAEAWAEALKILAKGDDLKPPSAQITFYEAVCLARLGKSDEAGRRAQEALAQCRPADKDLQTAIKNYIAQIPMAAVADEIGRAQKEIAKKRWREALDILEQALVKAPEAPILYFYKAVCLLNSDRRSEAKAAAEKGLEYAKGDAFADVRSELQKIVGIVRQGEQAAEMNSAVEAMNRGAWSEAKSKLMDIMKRRRTDPQVKYYIAVCAYRECLEEIPQQYSNQAKRDLAEKKFAEARAMLKLIENQAFLDPKLQEAVDQLEASMTDIEGRLAGLY